MKLADVCAELDDLVGTTLQITNPAGRFSEYKSITVKVLNQINEKRHGGYKKAHAFFLLSFVKGERYDGLDSEIKGEIFQIDSLTFTAENIEKQSFIGRIF